MGILKKFYEFLEPGEEKKGGEEIMTEIESPISDELRTKLEELKAFSQTGSVENRNTSRSIETGEAKNEISYKGYNISLPSELNGEGQPLTYLIVADSGKGSHAQAQSDKEIEDMIKSKEVFDSYKYNRKRK
jgi:hypothetical protein